MTQQKAAMLVVAPSPDGTYRYQTVSEWERGIRIPDASDLARICLAYGVTADWLLLERGPPRHRQEADAVIRLEAVRRILDAPDLSSPEAVEALVSALEREFLEPLKEVGEG